MKKYGETIIRLGNLKDFFRIKNGNFFRKKTDFFKVLRSDGTQWAISDGRIEE